MLTESANGHETVVQCCERARRMGVHAGLHLAEAQALLVGHPSRSAPFDARRDDEALKSIAAWASRFSPTVALVSPTVAGDSTSPQGAHGLLLDIKGCERLFGGEQRVMNALADAVQRFGIRVRTALADTVGCAWAVARFGTNERTAVAPGDERAVLTALPVAALRIDEKTTDALFEVSVEQIGHLFALSRRELVVRFGEELLLRLDQALGEAIERVSATPIVPPPRLQREFNGVVKNLETIERTVHELVIDIVHELQQRQCGARELKIEMTRAFLDPVREQLLLTRPSVDADHLWALLRPKIEKVHLGDGVERISIQAGRVAPLSHHQTTTWSGDAPLAGGDLAGGTLAERELAELLDVLVGECGAERVLRVAPLSSHVPEHAFVFNSVLGRSVLEPGRIAAAPTSPAERPSSLLERPEPIEVIALLPDGPPSWFKWRQRERRVIHAMGPERIGAPWWKGRRGWKARRGWNGRNEDIERCLAFRDYFKIQDEHGQWLWVFRGTETGRWFVHGEWA